MVEKEQLNEKAVAVRQAYMRQWRQKNRDKVRDIQNRYWMKRDKKRCRAGSLCAFPSS